MNAIYLSWFEDPGQIDDDIYITMVNNLIKQKKVPNHVMLQKKYYCVNTKMERKWEKLFGHQPKEKQWAQIHENNLKCLIETQLRSFYFNNFHNAIGINSLLYKIGRSNYPNCYFCSEHPETLKHLFCDCIKVAPLWERLNEKIYRSINQRIVLTEFNFVFGVQNGSLVTAR